ncbi:hypothetical protein [Desulfoscipio gibsoniae]|uniref:hypothetical protein n=1 Tax=Desulfoscipio gibsoniae TaxID=102134 RepID=UPI0003057D8C|nr:hypothetical protein [Desulfoscipio gibsoniae]
MGVLKINYLKNSYSGATLAEFTPNIAIKTTACLADGENAIKGIMQIWLKKRF